MDERSASDRSYLFAPTHEQIARTGRHCPATYYRRKLDEGASKKEALRALKRQISDAVYRQLVADARG